MKYLVVYTMLIALSILRTNGQSRLYSKDSNYEFSYNIGFNKFVSKQRDLSFNNQPVFTVGFFYMKKIFDKTAFDVELQVAKEYYNYLKVKSRSTNIHVPLNIFYQLFNTKISVITGAEYQFTKFNNSNLALDRNNFNFILGLNYSMVIGNIDIIPGVIYVRGLNNAIERLESDIGSIVTNLFVKRSSFMFLIKFM